MSITIRVYLDEYGNKRAQAIGEINEVIPDSEINTWFGSVGQISNAVGKELGRNPTDIYFKDPTPWGDKYREFGWPEVTRHLKPVSAEIVAEGSASPKVKYFDLINDSSRAGTFTSNLTNSFINTVTDTWTNTFGVSVEQKIDYSIGQGLFTLGGSTAIGFSEQWGQGGSHSSSETDTTGITVSTELGPHEAAVAVLTISRSILRVRVRYDAHVDGHVFLNYYPKLNGHYFFAASGERLANDMTSMGNQRSIWQTMDIDYYVSAKAQLLDERWPVSPSPSLISGTPESGFRVIERT